MTLEALYQAIDGDYEQALKVLRVEKLMDKHIRKLPQNKVFAALHAAGEGMDAEQLFENAHALKGVCSNLGLVKISEAASEIAEEFRPGSSRAGNGSRGRIARCSRRDIHGPRIGRTSPEKSSHGTAFSQR